MRTINLLPWREKSRQKAQKKFVATLGLTALVAAVVVLGVIRYHDARIANQNNRNQYLQSEIAKLDRQIVDIEEAEEVRSRLLQRKRVIEELQANRSLMVRMFDQLVRSLPDGVRLINARQVGDQITISGVTQSEARVSSYLRNLEASPVLHEPNLRIIESETAETDAQLPYGFRVEAKVGLPRQRDAGDEEFQP